MEIVKHFSDDVHRVFRLAKRMRAIPGLLRHLKSRYLPRMTLHYGTTTCKICAKDKGRNVYYKQCSECHKTISPERIICVHNRLAVDCGKCGK